MSNATRKVALSIPTTDLDHWDTEPVTARPQRVEETAAAAAFRDYFAAKIRHSIESWDTTQGPFDLDVFVQRLARSFDTVVRESVSMADRLTHKPYSRFLEELGKP